LRSVPGNLCAGDMGCKRESGLSISPRKGTTSL